jgi:hypothetical protein
MVYNLSEICEICFILKSVILEYFYGTVAHFVPVFAGKRLICITHTRTSKPEGISLWRKFI